MPRISLNADIHPLSDFRSNFSSYLSQVHNTKRPIVITQHGRSAAVLLDVAEYERMVDSLEVVEDIRRATAQIDKGLGVSHSEATKRLRGRRRT
jgi:prevent-host-death family protein